MGAERATHTHPFNGSLSRTTRVSRYQKGKTNLDFTEARDSEWQWHQLGMCKSTPRSRQITTPVPHHSVFTGRMPFLPPNQQRQSTEGNRGWKWRGGEFPKVKVSRIKTSFACDGATSCRNCNVASDRRSRRCIDTMALRCPSPLRSLGQLSLASLRGRLIEYQLRLG